MYAATPRVLITTWLDGVSLSTLLDGRMDLLPAGWRELSPGDAADLAARLLGHAIYAPAACTGWMHADLHPGNFLLLPDGGLGMLDFGAVAAGPAVSRRRSDGWPQRCSQATGRWRWGWLARSARLLKTLRRTRA